MNYRPARVGKLIREELSAIIVRELEFPGAIATITEVEVDKKLEHAKVYVSILPESKIKNSFSVLHEARGRLQHLLHNKINIKPMPRIVFEIDRGLAHAAVVEKRLLEDGVLGPASDKD